MRRNNENCLVAALVVVTVALIGFTVWGWFR